LKQGQIIDFSGHVGVTPGNSASLGAQRLGFGEGLAADHQQADARPEGYRP
jgi:hypothetical protein